MKPTIHISISGRSKIGKTTLMRAILKLLHNYRFETIPIWDIEDGPPKWAEDELVGRISKISKQTKISVTEIQSSFGYKNDEAFADFKVRVSYIQGKGYRVEVFILEEVLIRDYPDLPASKERAKILAERMAHELGVRVIDETPRETRGISTF